MSMPAPGTGLSLRKPALHNIHYTLCMCYFPPIIPRSNPNAAICMMHHPLSRAVALLSHQGARQQNCQTRAELCPTMHCQCMVFEENRHQSRNTHHARSLCHAPFKITKAPDNIKYTCGVEPAPRLSHRFCSSDCCCCCQQCCPIILLLYNGAVNLC
jgi:hypothetical protein